MLREDAAAISVRASVSAKAGARVRYAIVGMECTIPRKQLAMVLLIDPAVMWGTVTSLFMPETISTRARWADDVPLPYSFKRYGTTSGRGSPLEFVDFLSPVVKHFQSYN